jgi:Na+-transporting methylmalonyl-CoA/oxaloacetate decarboxylase gamma subunit
MEVKMIIFLSILVVLMAIAIALLEIKIIKIQKEAKKEKPKLTKEEKHKLEAARKAFNNLMEYGYEEAMKRK